MRGGDGDGVSCCGDKHEGLLFLTVDKELRMQTGIMEGQNERRYDGCRSMGYEERLCTEYL